jgi:hypothetical protein
MRSDTQSVTVRARPKDVIAFVGDGANLPRWAVGFAKSARGAGADWVVTTAQGDVATSIAVDETAGTIDFHTQAALGAEATAYSRAVPNADGAEFVFTQMQQPGMPDEVFDGLRAAVGHELVALKAVLEVECPL